MSGHRSYTLPLWPPSSVLVLLLLTMESLLPQPVNTQKRQNSTYITPSMHWSVRIALEWCRRISSHNISKHRQGSWVYDENEILPLLFYVYCASLGLSTWDLRSGSNVEQGSGSKDHFNSAWPWSGSKLSAVLHDSAWDPVQQCNAHSLRAMWSSRETKLNSDQVPGFSKSDSVPM